MLIARIDELTSVVDGQRIEVQGRYERWNPDFAPPGTVPITARVVLAGGGGGVLIGRYQDLESRRSDDELAALAGAIVRVAGTFIKSREFPGPGAPPGLWTGGGPQIVDVRQVELVEAAKPLAATPVVQSPPLPVVHVAVSTPAAIPARVASTIPSHVGLLARKSLADGSTWIVSIGTFVALLVGGAGALFALPAAGTSLGRRFDSGILILGGYLASLGVNRATVHWFAARELRWLVTLPWNFDLPAYLSLLDEERAEGALRIDVELVAPVSAADRSSLVDVRRLGRATVDWTGDRSLSIRCPMKKTEWSGGPSPAYGLPSHSNGPLHRWFRRCAFRALEPLHAARGIRAIDVRVS